ncbi:tripartite tricarboxylate transporter TctB family protein [Halalkalibacterium ligniniphilum]|uniref:tripartite tricarboxylate transporter TctB family protein n=1 Tax=Halalkalibacterium ligniniphilum TaxID=1134413 RepID=UPI0003497719|nr:tripartite tricarboxylate transporter TctB family protein [Halalkalibacterium ligniniphilum]
MITINERSIFSFFIFLFAAVLLVNSSDMQGNVILVPRIVGFILLVFSGVQFLLDLVPGIRRAIPFLNKDLEDDAEILKGLGKRFLFIGWMVLFVILIFFTSMIWATAISFFLYLKWISKESWKLSIIYTSIFTTTIYFVFVVAMGIYYFL